MLRTPAVISTTQLLLDYHSRYDQDEEDDRQEDGDAEEDFFNAAPGGKYASCIPTRQSAESGALALKDHASDQRDGRYNQGDIQVKRHNSLRNFWFEKALRGLTSVGRRIIPSFY